VVQVKYPVNGFSLAWQMFEGLNDQGGPIATRWGGSWRRRRCASSGVIVVAAPVIAHAFLGFVPRGQELLKRRRAAAVAVWVTQHREPSEFGAKGGQVVAILVAEDIFPVGHWEREVPYEYIFYVDRVPLMTSKSIDTLVLLPVSAVLTSEPSCLRIDTESLSNRRKGGLYSTFFR